MINYSKVDTALGNANLGNLAQELEILVNNELLKIKSDKEVKVAIFKPGIIISKKPKQHGSKDNLLLTTIHNGTYIPANIEKYFYWNSKRRRTEEDIGTADLYRGLFHELGGTWINVLFSRFWIDLNRTKENALFKYEADTKYNVNLEKMSKYLEESEKYYNSFYALIAGLIQEDNLFIFSGHSMRDKKDRPDYCLIHKSDDDELGLAMLLENARINDPFQFDGGYLMKYISTVINNYKSVEFEVNKKLYTEDDDITIINQEKLNSISNIIINKLKKLI